MSVYYRDNILAIATAPQNGAIGVIRLSGPDVKEIAQKSFVKPSGEPFGDFQPRYLHFGHVLSEQGEVMDQVLMAYMPGPHSFTGEDVVEFHCHGNLILMKGLIRTLKNRIKNIEVREALPGEFTKRAFLNGKLDLTEAESVHEVISASSEAALQASLKNLSGKLNNYIVTIKEKLKNSLALVEASFEFPEEDIQTYNPKDTAILVKQALLDLQKLKDSFATSQLYDNGLSVVLVGKPNVGKSSLLNALLQEDRAIVTDVPGTTRDVVEGAVVIDGVRCIFSDTAGIRETSCEVEGMGIEKSHDKIDSADIILYIFDNLNDISFNDSAKNNKACLKILNKADLFFTLPGEGRLIESHNKEILDLGFDGAISATKQWGIAWLKQQISSVVKSKISVHNSVHINQRQFLKISEAIEALEKVKELLESSLGDEDVLAEELRCVVGALAEVTGEVSSEDVLGEIFRRFCIGK